LRWEESGIGILEVVFATGLLAVAAAGLLAGFSYSVAQSRGQGEIATMATDLGRDKVEQLLALDFNDGATDTTRYPTTPTGGTGLGGTMAANATVGGINPAAPTTSYVDYLDVNGNLLTGPSSAFYTRQWRISTNASAKVKTITVVTTALTAGAPGGPRPSTTLVCAKALLQ
jgi:hypothetical protein